MNDAQLCVRNPFQKLVFIELVHQKTDRAAVHAVNRHVGSHEAVQRLQHEAIAAQRDDDARFLRLDPAIALGKTFQCLLRFGSGTCNKSEANLISKDACPRLEQRLPRACGLQGGGQRTDSDRQ